MPLASTAISYNGANTDFSISEMQSLACQFRKCCFNFVLENTDLSISEGFFNKIMGLGSVLLCLRGRLNEGNWFTLGLPWPELSFYGDHYTIYNYLLYYL